MNRAEIKNAAKEKIKGNIWNLIWPLLVIGFVTGLLTSLLGPKMTYQSLILYSLLLKFFQFLLPALVCNPSIFCVTIPSNLFFFSSS